MALSRDPIFDLTPADELRGVVLPCGLAATFNGNFNLLTFETPVAVLGFAVWGASASGVAIFSAGWSQNYTIATTNPGGGLGEMKRFHKIIR